MKKIFSAVCQVIKNLGASRSAVRVASAFQVATEITSNTDTEIASNPDIELVPGVAFSEEALLLNPYENFEGELERDEFGNIHVGECLVGYKFGQHFVGKTVQLHKIVENHNPLCPQYPYFACRMEVKYAAFCA